MAVFVVAYTASQDGHRWFLGRKHASHSLYIFADYTAFSFCPFGSVLGQMFF